LRFKSTLIRQKQLFRHLKEKHDAKIYMLSAVYFTQLPVRLLKHKYDSRPIHTHSHRVGTLQ
jgi:hypothetical protein